MKVYLIDDKKLRQSSDYHWSNERFGKFKDFIQCIYTLEELENRSKEVFSDDNVIIYHESFIDQTTKSKEAIEKRNKLSSWSEHKGNLFIYFSGSKNTREIKDNIAFIPVSTLYANLEIFLSKIAQNDVKLEYLLFGENIDIEIDLIKKQETALNATFEENSSNINGTNLFISPSKNFISSPLLNIEEKTIFTDVSDEKLSERINEWLSSVQYDNIFLPLCFGNILSDYNGLRLASHIRCTQSNNQLSRIFIYGFVGMDYIVNNEYFNILKTKNVVLIPFSKEAFGKFVDMSENQLSIDELPDELAKLKLDVPGNYFDSHHIANEWGVFQMARNADLKIEDIEGFSKEKLNSIYFKWLIAKNNLYEKLPEDQIVQQKDYAERLPGLSIKGKIDLSKISKR